MGGCKPKQNASKLAHAKKQKQKQSDLHKVGKDWVLNKLAQSPVPVVVLSNSQAKKVEPHCLKVKFCSARFDRSRKCWDIKWKKISKGPKFQPQKEGLIVCEVGCIKELKRRHRSHKRLCCTGEADGETEPAQDMLAVLARWNRDGAKMGKKKNICLHEAVLKGVPTVKPPLFKHLSGKHHGSSGYYYAHGKTGTCGPMDDNQSSVHAFALKRSSTMSLEEMEKLDNQHTQALATEILRAEETINGGALAGTSGTAITKSGTVFAKAIEVYGVDVNPKLESNLGMIPGTNYPAAFLCHNASTAEEHTEPDCSYTIIRSPNQPGMEYKDSKARASFNFHLDTETVKVPLLLGMNCWYNGCLIPHNQQLCDCKGDFRNVSCYGNMKYFSYGRSTIRRNYKRTHPDHKLK